MSLLGVFREDLDNPVSVICVFLLEAALSSAFRIRKLSISGQSGPREFRAASLIAGVERCC